MSKATILTLVVKFIYIFLKSACVGSGGTWTPYVFVILR